MAFSYLMNVRVAPFIKFGIIDSISYPLGNMNTVVHWFPCLFLSIFFSRSISLPDKPYCGIWMCWFHIHPESEICKQSCKMYRLCLFKLFSYFWSFLEYILHCSKSHLYNPLRYTRFVLNCWQQILVRWTRHTIAQSHPNSWQRSYVFQSASPRNVKTFEICHFSSFDVVHV